MGRLDRFKKEGITWPQFFFQFVIVLLGVYLAIFFERKAQERDLQEDTVVMLQNVLTELEQDEDEIERIRGIVGQKVEWAREMAALLENASQDDASAVDSLVHLFTSNNRTAFLRKSTYTAMVAGGYLRTLVRTEFPGLFADLYERTYTRVTATGEFQDYMVFEYLLPAHMEHLDVGGRRFIEPGPEANVRFRNVALRLAISADWYRGFLGETLEQVQDVKRAVEEYVADNG